MYRILIILHICLAIYLVGNKNFAYASRPVTQGEYTIFLEAKHHLDNGNYKSSIDGLERYFRQTGQKHNYAYELYGMVLINTKQYKKAVEILTEGFEIYPENAIITQNLASAHYQTGQFLKAGQNFEKAYILSERKNHDLASTAAYCYIRVERYNSAINILKALTSLAKPKAVWFQMLGQAYFSKGEKKSAVSSLEKGLTYFKEDASLWSMLGYIYYNQKEQEKAAAAYEIAYKFKAPSKNEAEQLASLYYSIYAPYSGKRLLPLQNTPVETLDYISVLFAKSRDFSTAAEVAKLALEKEFSDARRFRLGQIYFHGKFYTEATNIFREMANNSGEYAEKAQYMLAEMAWENENWKNMAKELETLVNMQGEFMETANQLLDVVEQLADEKLKAYAYHEESLR